MTTDRSPFMHRERAPGSPDAVAAGCTCPIMDNARGKGVLLQSDPNDEPTRAWWIAADCPLHSEPHPTTAQQTGQYD